MSKRGFLAVATTVVAGAGLVACVLNGPANAPPPAGMAHVEMGLRSSSPKTLTIRRGETIQFRNISIFPHTVTNNAGPPAGRRSNRARFRRARSISSASTSPAPTPTSAGIMRTRGWSAPSS
jgi:plastocyanin